MTRPFNSRVRCQHCNGITTEESPMERWIRNNPLLSSSNGIVRYDIDILLHRYKTVADLKGDREIEFMMFVEVKTFNANLTLAQRDTLGLLNQVLRNRRKNKHSSPRRQMGGQPLTNYSIAKQRRIPLRLFGGHLLQLSGAAPDTSDNMRWDGKNIDLQTLVELMMFDRDPDNLNANKEDWLRRRSKPFAKMPTLWPLFQDLIPPDPD